MGESPTLGVEFLTACLRKQHSKVRHATVSKWEGGPGTRKSSAVLVLSWTSAGRTGSRNLTGVKTVMRGREREAASETCLHHDIEDGSELQAQLDATIKEAAVLQDKLRLEEQRHRSELEAAEVGW